MKNRYDEEKERKVGVSIFLMCVLVYYKWVLFIWKHKNMETQEH